MAILTWITGFLAVFSFYASPALGLPKGEATPLLAAALGSCLVLLTALGFVEWTQRAPQLAGRQLALLLLCLALGLFAMSVISAAAGAPMGVRDWGEVALRIGTPVLLLIYTRRMQLLFAIGAFAALFASIDLGFNVLTHFGVMSLAKSIGDRGGEYGLHMMGLAGNSLAEGTVAFIAVGFLALWARQDAMWVGWRVAAGVLELAILGGMVLINSNTYLFLALLAAVLTFVLTLGRIPAFVIITGIVFLFLWRIFGPGIATAEDQMRAWIILDGVHRALLQPFLGAGIFYLDTYGVRATFNSETAAGITESGILDMAVAFGIPATVCMIGSCIAAVSSWRIRSTLPAIMLTLMTAALAFSEPLSSLLGSLFFYLCLTWVILDEEPVDLT